MGERRETKNLGTFLLDAGKGNEEAEKKFGRV